MPESPPVPHEGWTDRVRGARDRAIADARREIEREIADAFRDDKREEDARRAGPFEDEFVGDGDFRLEPLDDAPVAPEPQDAPRSGDGGRIGF